MTDISHAHIGHRVKKTEEHPHGWEIVKQIDPDEPCILALAGSGAKDSKSAHGMAKMIDGMLDVTIPIYAAEYDLADRRIRVDREAVLARHGQENDRFPFINEVSEDAKTYVPLYIRDIYKATIAPRLRDEKGLRLNKEKVAQRLNMLMLFTHCHGSTVAFQLEYLMQKDMQRLGYSDKEKDYLTKQLIAVNVAPVTPYGVSKITNIKFGSFADDFVMSVGTKKLAYIYQRKLEHKKYIESIKENNTTTKKKYRPYTMDFCMFRPTARETVFAVNNMYPVEMSQKKGYEQLEHVLATYTEGKEPDQTFAGQKLNDAFFTVVNYMAKHALTNKTSLKELPEITTIKEFKKYITEASKNSYNLVNRELEILRRRSR